MSIFENTVMIKKRPSYGQLFAQYLLIALTILSALGTILFSPLGLFVPTVLFAVFAYFMHGSCDMEYEYTYIEGELDIDKIKAKRKRKKVAKIDLDELILIAPQELRLPDYMLAEMAENSHLEFREVETMEEVMPELDILYMTRVQKERFLDEEEFDRVKNSFVLNPEKLKTAKEDMIILHPLPRVNEITRAVDNDPRAAYFRQVENGKFVRMALIYTLLRWADENRPFERTPVFSERYVVNEYECPNRRCISATEDVDRLFHRQADGTCRCAYCEAKAR